MWNRKSNLLTRSVLGLYVLLGGCSSLPPEYYDSELKDRIEREPYSVLKSNRDDGSLFRETYLFVDSDEMAVVQYGPKDRRSVTWYRLEPGLKTKATRRILVEENRDGVRFVGEASTGD